MPMLNDDGVLVFPANADGMSDLERRLAIGRASAERAAARQQSMQPPTPVQPDQPQEKSTLMNVIDTLNSYVEPTQYFGGALNTAMMGMPVGRVLGAIRTLAAREAAPTAAAAPALPALQRPVTYGGLHFTPEQWARIVHSNMPAHLGRGGQGFVNVAEGAVPMSGAPRAVPFSPAYGAARRPPQTRPTREIAPYSAAERERVRNAAMQERKARRAMEYDPYSPEMVRARVERARSDLGLDERLRDALEAKGQLDARTIGILR